MREGQSSIAAPFSRSLSLVPPPPNEVLLDVLLHKVEQQLTATETVALALHDLASRMEILERTIEELRHGLDELTVANSPAAPILDHQYTRRFRRNI
jgi:hypothetical protein